MKRIASYTVIASAIIGAAGAGNAVSQDDSMPRVGFVAGAGGYPKMAVTNQAFFDGLADAGFKDGTTMKVVFRTAEGDMSLMPELIKTVLAENVDYLVVSTSPGCAAAKKGSFEKRVGHAACRLSFPKSSLPASRKTTARMVEKLA